MRTCITLLLQLLLFAFCSGSEDQPGVMDKIKAGFEIAGKFLSWDRASNLAQLVSQTFGEKADRHASSNPGSHVNIFSGFLRLLGLDSKKLSAIAVNAIIFIAQLISSTLSKPPPSHLTAARKLEENGNPLEWMLNNSNVANMFGDIKDVKLSNSIVEYIKERGLDEDTDCIQMLICKTAPLIWSMQKVVNGSVKVSKKGSKAFFAYLPTVQEFASHGDTCEKQHPYCLIYY